MKLELKIVRLLSKDISKSLTINEISKNLNEYYSFVHRIINRLVKDGVVKKTKAGNSYLCSLNLENEKTTALLQLSEIESKNEFYSKNKELKLLLEDFVKSINSENATIVLFGSYAKGSVNKASDVDILVVIDRKINADETTKEVYAKYGKEINVIIMTSGEFKKQRSKEIIKEIIENHFVLSGAENFVKLVFG